MPRYATLGLMTGLLLALPQASAQGVGSPKTGLAYARQNCAECHAVEKGGWESPNPDAPSFQSIAQTQGFSWIALSAFLQTPHKTMPNFLLQPQDREDVIALILSLKPE